LIADTKFEFGYAKGKLKFGDELFTPDSSRYWDEQDWEHSRENERSPQSLDKQFVRDFAKTLGIDKRNPALPEDRAFVGSCVIPPEIIDCTRRIYRYIFWRMTSKKLELFQRENMGIDVNPPRVHLDLIVGSRSDLAQATPALEKLNELRKTGLVDPQLHIISCHRNPEALRGYAEELKNVDVIVAGAGKAAALPGALTSWLRFFGKNNIPVIGVAFEGDTSVSSWAATLSIEEVPGQPVVLNENGNAYRGAKGCLRACERAVQGEFLPDSRERTSIDSELNLNVWK
ncbi:MAG: phosphoribosylaminoimidazolesuccinocarboxamide synthase, partial [Patescibacteria group bacterium]